MLQEKAMLSYLSSIGQRQKDFPFDSPPRAGRFPPPAGLFLFRAFPNLVGKKEKGQYRKSNTGRKRNGAEKFFIPILASLRLNDFALKVFCATFEPRKKFLSVGFRQKPEN